MMRVFLLTILLIARGIVAQDCSASVTLVERAGSWILAGEEQRIFDVHLTNNGTCSFSGSVAMEIGVPAGNSLGYCWGYNVATQQVVGVPELSPQQSYSGVGFIWSGYGEPVATATEIFSSCTCGTSSTTGSTPAPTTSPTPTPTPGPTLPPSSAFDRDMVVLVLTCNATADLATLSVATMILNSMGQPAVVVDYSVIGSAPLSLTNADGTGKYYAIVSESMLTCWTAAQQTQLQNYEIQYMVKLVILYSSPSTSNGVSLVSSTSASGNLTYAPAMVPFARSMRTDPQILVYDSWVYQTQISDTQLATPAFYLNIAGTQYVGAALINYPDTRRHLEFYFAPGTWALFSTVLGTTWLNWVTNGVFAGARRIVLSCHTDDVFMQTGMFSPTTDTESTTNIYRLTPGDVEQLMNWHTGLIARLPAGSNFQVTFPFNGQTIQQFGGYTVDPLYLYLHQPSIRQAFYWESHTWDHPILDNYTYDQCYQEWFLNNATALELFDNDLTNPNYNPTAVITPSISGLFNGPCLQAMWDLGIRYICGDNTISAELPSNDYWGWYTNTTSNGFAGMFVVPRWATNIDYDASQTTQIYEEYNFLYGTNYDFNDIMAIEVTTNTRHLLAYRHDPFMFHQANMRNSIINGQNTSLLANWVDIVVDSVMQYSTLPINSYSHTEQALQLIERQARDQCGFQGTLRMNTATNSIVGISAVSTGTCTYAISGVQATPNDYITVETVGEETTIWIDMTPNNPVNIVFTTPIPIV